MSDKMLNTDETAKVLKVGRRTVYRYVKEGKLNPVAMGRTLLFPEDEVSKFIKKGNPRVKAPGRKRISTKDPSFLIDKEEIDKLLKQSLGKSYSETETVEITDIKKKPEKLTLIPTDKDNIVST